MPKQEWKPTKWDDEALSKAEEGKDGMSVVRLGYVYSIIKDMQKTIDKQGAELAQLRKLTK